MARDLACMPDPVTAGAPTIEVPPQWRRVDFISDLHLADETPRTFDAWRAYLLQTDADAVFILGDLFEAWVGDDSRFEGFEARGTAVLTAAAARRPLHFMIGNRDFLLGAEMLAACGIAGLDDPTVLDASGERVLLTHGDAWCLGDVDYLRFRAQVRHPAWQQQVLARSLAERRLLARNLRSESERKFATHEGEWADVDRPTALAWMSALRTPTLVHGHTHRPVTEALSEGARRHVLSDWDFERSDTPRGEVLRWTPPGAWRRLSLAEATPDPVAPKA